jgi:hypothetical protein
MQALRRALQRTSLLPVPSNVRHMGGAPSVTPEARWARYFPEAPDPTPAELQKSVRKEIIGFLILGPASAALMVYDLVFGLEHHEFHAIPP